MSSRELRSAVGALRAGREPKRDIFYGWMLNYENRADGSARVTDEPGYVYVLVDRGEGVSSGDVVKCWSRFRPVHGWPVLVGPTRERPWDNVVLEIDTEAMGGAIDGFPALEHHHETHEWGEPTGSDDVVSPRFLSLYDFAVWPDTGIAVNVSDGVFNPEATKESILYQTIDISHWQPSGSGSRWVLVCLTPSGTIETYPGQVQSFLTLDDVPEAPFSDWWELAAVRLDYDDTEIIMRPDTENIVDLRFSRLGWPQMIGGGVGGTWENVVIVAKSGGQYTTINGGEAGRAPNDVLVVLPGTYSENVVITENGPVVAVLGADTAGNTVIDGADDVGPIVDFDVGRSFKGPRLSRTLAGGAGEFTALDANQAGVSPEISYCRIDLDDGPTGRDLTGIDVSGDADAVYIVHTRISLVGAGTNRAIRLNGGTVVIQDCEITGDIVCDSATTLVLRNCSITGNVTGMAGCTLLIGTSTYITGVVTAFDTVAGHFYDGSTSILEVLGGLDVSASTAAAPVAVLQTTDDDATNPILEIQDSGGNALTVVDSSGRAGIGIDAPLQLLHIRDVTPIMRIHDTKEGSWTEGDVFSGIEFFTDDDTLGSPFVNAYIRSTHLRSGTHTSADAGLEFGTSHYQADPVLSTKMVISNIGNVGIGTITPLRSLHIHHAEFAYVHLTGPNSGAGPLDGITFGLDDKNSRGHFRLREPWPLVFWTNSIERLTIDGDGLVGIGDQTPSAQLEIAVSGAAVIGQIIKGAAAQSANLLEFQESDGSIFLASGDGLGGSIFSGNQQLEDIDFVWAGDTEANLFRVDAGADVVRIGDWDTNYVEVDNAGNMAFVGTATVWNDIYFPASSGKIGGANQPTWAAFQGNTMEYTFAINDYIHLPTQEIAHSYKEGSDISLHVHIVLDGSDAGDTDVNYEIEYTIGDLDEVMSAAAVITSGDFTITGGTADRTHLRIEIGDIVGTNLLAMSALKMRFRRIALVGGGNAPSNDPFVLMVGAHIEEDTVGSRTETAK